MAKIVRCDNCQKEQSATVLDSTPPTWLDITEQMPGALPNEHHHVCSRRCGAELLMRPREEATAPPMPMPDVPDIPF